MMRAEQTKAIEELRQSVLSLAKLMIKTQEQLNRLQDLVQAMQPTKH